MTVELPAGFTVRPLDADRGSIQSISIDQAQGSAENLSSLTAAVNADPRNPEAYNVRGIAYGRSGDNRRAAWHAGKGERVG